MGHVSDREVFGVTNPLGKVAEDVGFGEYVLLPKILGPRQDTLLLCHQRQADGLPVVTTAAKVVP